MYIRPAEQSEEEYTLSGEEIAILEALSECIDSPLSIEKASLISITREIWPLIRKTIAIEQILEEQTKDNLRRQIENVLVKHLVSDQIKDEMIFCLLAQSKKITRNQSS